MHSIKNRTNYPKPSSIFIRFSIGGCVAKRLDIFSKKLLERFLLLSRSNSLTSLFDVFNSEFPETFFKASARACEFFVSSTAPASAKYSRLRERASLNMRERKKR